MRCIVRFFDLVEPLQLLLNGIILFFQAVQCWFQMLSLLLALEVTVLEIWIQFGLYFCWSVLNLPAFTNRCWWLHRSLFDFWWIILRYLPQFFKNGSDPPFPFTVILTSKDCLDPLDKIINNNGFEAPCLAWSLVSVANIVLSLTLFLILLYILCLLGLIWSFGLPNAQLCLWCLMLFCL